MGLDLENRLSLHICVVRPLAALRRHPLDILPRILDVAGFAVNAVLGIDLQAWCGIGRRDDFIDPGRAVALFRGVVEGQVDGDGQRRIAQAQMAGLVFLMVRIAEMDG